MTGTLFSAGHDLAAAVLGRGRRWTWLLHGLVWTALMAGAAGGAATYGQSSRWSLTLPLAATIFLMVLALIRVVLCKSVPEGETDGASGTTTREVSKGTGLDARISGGA